MTEKKGTKHNPGLSINVRLYDVLAAHRRALVAAGCEKQILNEYSILLHFLRPRSESRLSEMPASPTENVIASSKQTFQRPQKRLISESEVMESSLDQLQELVRDDAVARKDLERIAIQRFSVPRGSMRSFSNRRMLVGKLLTLIRNEQAHETISRIARREDQRK
jgi:hypothetical protein